MIDEKAEEREELVGMYGVLDALEGVIAASDPAKRETLAWILDAYAENFPEDFYRPVSIACAAAPFIDDDRHRVPS